MTILAFIVVLGPLILVHELGHFLAAKLTGVRVEEFGLGWPPRLFKFWQSSSRLTVGNLSVVTPSNYNIPADLKAGQYVELVAVKEQERDDYVLRELRILDVESDDLAPKREEVNHQVRARGKLRDLDLGTAYTLNWIPLGGFCRMTGEEDPSDPHSLAAQSKRVRFAVLTAGCLMNLVVAFLLFSTAFFSGVPEPVDGYVVIEGVASDSPALEAGLQPGDVIRAVNGISMETNAELVEYINSQAGETIELTLERDGERLTKSVNVRAESHPEGRVGISILTRSENYVLQHSSISEAIGQGLDQFVFSFKQLIRLPGMLISRQIGAEEIKPVGPVGISQMAGDAIERSTEQESLFTILFFAGAISMALGVTNLLPLPALDGGRLLFVLIEALRGRRVDPAKEGVVHLIGMALLLGFMIIITLQELMNPVTSPF